MDVGSDRVGVTMRLPAWMGNRQKTGLGEYEQIDSFPVLVWRSQSTWCFAKRCLHVLGSTYLSRVGRLTKQLWEGQTLGQVAFYDGQLTGAEMGQRHGLKGNCLLHEDPAPPQAALRATLQLWSDFPMGVCRSTTLSKSPQLTFCKNAELQTFFTLKTFLSLILKCRHTHTPSGNTISMPMVLTSVPTDLSSLLSSWQQAQLAQTKTRCHLWFSHFLASFHKQYAVDLAFKT